MASGHVTALIEAEHMAAPTNTALVKKVLANSEPSTHGPSYFGATLCPFLGPRRCSVLADEVGPTS
jgi:hypothetical protein